MEKEKNETTIVIASRIPKDTYNIIRQNYKSISNYINELIEKDIRENGKNYK